MSFAYWKREDEPKWFSLIEDVYGIPAGTEIYEFIDTLIEGDKDSGLHRTTETDVGNDTAITVSVWRYADNAPWTTYRTLALTLLFNIVCGFQPRKV